MGLALGVDYSLLIVSRFREELDGDRPDVARAAETASQTAGRTVLFAGVVLLVTMIVAVLLSPGDLLLSVTVGVTTAVVLSMVSGCVIVPALLLLLGSRMNRWQIGSPQRRASLLPALARFAIRHAPLVLAATLVLLLATSTLALDLRTTAINVRVLPPDNAARLDVEEVADLVGYGYVTPFEISLHADDALITEPRTLRAIERFQRGLLRDPGVASLIGPGALASRTGAVLEVPKRIPRLRRQGARAAAGVERLRDGLLQASEGAGRLRDGAQQAQAGVTRLHAGAQQLDVGAGALRRGVQAAADGTDELARGETDAARGAAQLHDGASDAHAGSMRLVQGVGLLGTAVAQLDDGTRSLATGIEGAGQQLTSLLGPPLAATDGQLQAAFDALSRMTVGRDDPAYGAALAAVANAAAITGGTNPETGAHAGGALPSAMAQASAGITALAADARDLSDSATVVKNNVGSVNDGATSLTSGLGRLAEGQGRLSDGLSEAAARVGTAQSRFGQLVDGADRLAAGTSRLTSGIGQLSGSTSCAAAAASSRSACSRATARPPPSPPACAARWTTSATSRGCAANAPRGTWCSRASSRPRLRAAASSSSCLTPPARARARGCSCSRRCSPRPTPRRACTTASAAGRRPSRRAHQLDAAVGGPAARFPEFQRVVSAFIPRLIAVLSLLTFLLLVVVLRALLLPAVAIVLNLLIVAATFGCMKLLFQGADPLLGGPGAIDVTTAAGVFTILFALSLDYQVFLLTRMREGYLRTGEADAAIEHGIAHTARVVTGAAVIMAAVFLSFGASEFTIPRQLGVGLAIAVLLDALVLRLFMLPAAMHLLGRRGWWLPAWLERTLPHVDPEGDSGLAAAHRRPDRERGLTGDAARATPARSAGSCPPGRARRRRARPRAGWRAPAAPPRRARRRPSRRSRRGRRRGTAAGQLALREQRGDRVAVLLRAAGVWLGQHDLDLGLAVARERDPAEAVARDLVTHGQAEGVAVEGEGGVGVVDEDVDVR